MSGTITVGLDGTDHAAVAADWAAQEAERRGSALRLVHAWVWRPTDVAYVGDRAAEERWVRDMLDEARSRVAGRHPALDVTTELIVDDPVPTLLAEAAHADTLVLGSRGYGTLTGYLLGSVSMKVLRHAAGPVVMVGKPHSAAPREAQEVVVGVEPGQIGDAVLEFAFSAAAERGATLRAVHAWSVPTALAWSPGSLYRVDEANGLEQINREALTETLKPWRDTYPQVEVVEHCEIGSASEVLLSNSVRAGLVVVGRRSHDAGLRRLGPVTHAVLHHATAPVAVVPHDCPPG
ncbi:MULTISPECIES: universal stress protein [Streptomyces]|uniref:Universal stress protein n=1 Tax=Streptomyces sindenensis TaxID=67363 RepID=A0ABW6EIM4_9ACTN|nr:MULTISPECIES: universal stress protein [Streptomyces]WGP13209.1 universal stress protein [Streptomyces sp. SH5]GGP59561.1 universal stress protein [Streptomyces sindenensis]